jgi:SAM-dependent methyltransferase
MTDRKNKLSEFVAWVDKHIQGDEKGESQTFLDRLFVHCGHEGHREAGANFEYRIRSQSARTKYADLVWGSTLLLEMKKRGEKLERHREQILEYWLGLTPNRPNYVVLCNFDEFWVYDFNSQIEAPVDRVSLRDLADRYEALSFLFPEQEKPVFQNDLVAVTRGAAGKVATVLNSLLERGEQRIEAQRFILQCVFALFSERIGLLPHAFFTRLLEDCLDGQSSYDLLGGLFRQMDKKSQARHGRFQNVPYFDGGLFAVEVPIELTTEELNFLREAAKENWAKVQPAIFGAIFESSVGNKSRHAWGAHYTREADIAQIVIPSIEKPWRERIEKASTLKELLLIRDELVSFRVLDPACGSGNFLYVAYRYLKRIEADLINKIISEFPSAKELPKVSFIRTNQFFGIDNNHFAVELAKVTLVIAKKLALDEFHERLEMSQLSMKVETDPALPLDNLDKNIVCDDALFCDWPKVNAIIGNPPFQSKNKMRQELGHDYVDRVRSKFPDIPGRADFCVYWFRKSHDELPNNGRAGLIGTNSITQNYSRQGGLDYIVSNGGTITDAVASQPWPGDAQVDVSIVNWVKGNVPPGKKKLLKRLGDRPDSEWKIYQLDRISSALSPEFDITQALPLEVPEKLFYQGQIDGVQGSPFRLSPENAAIMAKDPSSRSVIHPFLIGTDLLANVGGFPSEYVIDLNHCMDVTCAKKYKKAFDYLERNVLPKRQEAALKERNETGKQTGEKQSLLKRWWHFDRGRGELLGKLARIQRYIACSRVTKRCIFEFVSSDIHPNDLIQVFIFEDDYSFGILQSKIHWDWFTHRGSSLTARARNTPETGFRSFPWPQDATPQEVRAVADAGIKLRVLRKKIMKKNNWSLRTLYQSLDIPGPNLLREAHDLLDFSVRSAYGIKEKDDALEFLFNLNVKFTDRQSDKTRRIVAPGLPPCIKNPSDFITQDKIEMPPLY